MRGIVWYKNKEVGLEKMQQIMLQYELMFKSFRISSY